MGEADKACVCEPDTGGNWRKGEFVVWTDLFIFVEATLVWVGLLVAVVAAVLVAPFAQSGSLDYTGLTAVEQNPLFRYAMSASVYLVMLFFFVRVANRVADESLAARFRSLPGTTFVLWLLTGMALAVLMPILIGLLTQHHLISLTPTKSELRIVPHGLDTWLAALIGIGLIAPFTEELYFRGILLGWLKRKMPTAVAVLVSAVLFALVHFNFVSHGGAGGWVVTGIILIVGLITAVAALKTRSLWASFAIHAGYNSVLISLPMLQILMR